MYKLIRGSAWDAMLHVQQVALRPSAPLTMRWADTGHRPCRVIPRRHRWGA